MTQTTKREIAGWLYLPTMILAFCVAVGVLLGRAWWGALACYALATALRLTAGAFMNRIGDAEAVNAWNKKYHRKVVIVLNVVVGAVLWGRLAWDVVTYEHHVAALVFLTVAFVAYFIAARFTAPNTFGARVRSAVLTIVLIEIMAYLAFGMTYLGLYVVFGMAVGILAVVRLAHLADRFGWADR